MPKFKPSKPFSLYTDGANYGNQTKNSRFISDLSRLHIDMGGVLLNVYRLKGTFDQERDALNVKVDDKGSQEEAIDIASFMGVQDTILNENRDREYDFDEIPIMKGTYTVSQNELEYLRFGLVSANDIITMEFHAQEMEKQLGRRMIPGDVIEMPHLREVGIDGRVANKWYEVGSVVWSPTGYDPMFARHILAVLLKPMRHQQEFLDIFEREDEYCKTLADQASNLDAMMSITTANQVKAREHANTTWHDTTIMWFDPDHPSSKPYRWNDDAKPPNGVLPVGQGNNFPPNPTDGDWFLRTDFEPNKLFRFQNECWVKKEEDIKREWQPYNWVVKLREFMSDRSEEDRDRKWELRSIQDVITERENRSDPTGDEDNSDFEI